MMVDISLVWISQSWKVLNAPGFAGYEKSGDRTRDGPRLHGRTAPKSAKTQCPRGMPRPYGPRGRWLNMTTTTTTTTTINIHGGVCKGATFLGKVRGKKKGTITIISSHATRIKGNITALKKSSRNVYTRSTTRTEITPTGPKQPPLSVYQQGTSRLQRATECIRTR